MGRIYTVPSLAPGCLSCHRVALGTGGPSMLASVRQPRPLLQHHGWWPPVSCLPSSLLSLLCACHPPPLPPRDRRTEFPPLLLQGTPAWLLSSLDSVSFLLPHPNVTSPFPSASFLPSSLSRKDQLASSEGFICSFVFCRPCYHQCAQLWIWESNHRSHNPCRIPWGKEC